jgi:hypothetical protein
MKAIGLAVLPLLGYIAWQDFKYRAVYAWLFIVLLISFAVAKGYSTTWTLMWQDLGFNLAFLGLQLILLTIYFSVKSHKWVNIFRALFGLGDLFFLISISAYFSTYNYIAYYLLSLIFVLLLTLILRLFRQPKNASIPLAGEQALLLMICMLIAYFVPDLNLVSDQWLVYYLTN